MKIKYQRKEKTSPYSPDHSTYDKSTIMECYVRHLLPTKLFRTGSDSETSTEEVDGDVQNSCNSSW